jgi:hypothetical protein
VTAQPGHYAPLEHVSTPSLPLGEYRGNLRGWNQLRHVYDC